MASTNPSGMRRRAAIISLGIATAAAFAGGVAVVAVQYGLGIVSAGYPPVVQAVTCAAENEQDAGQVALLSQEGALLPVLEFPAGSRVACRIDAPGSDYATWSIVGPVTAIRSGPLDPQLPCQMPEDFEKQDPSMLGLSTCQSFVARHPGLYLMSVTVMLRGLPSVDRARLLIRVLPDAEAVPPSPATRMERLAVSLRLPAATVQDVRTRDLSASFGEHGLLPQSRSFQRTVYRLAAGETFVSAAFRVRSASNASAVTLRHDPRTRSVTAQFTLRSGPLIDRWRGWISGTVEVRVRLDQPAREVALPETELPVPGRVEIALPEAVDDQPESVLLRPAGATAGVEVAPGGTARLAGARITATIADRRLILNAAAE